MKVNPSTIAVRNLQRKVTMDVVDLEKFSTRALELCLQLPRKKKSDSQQLHAIFVLIVSDRKMAALHRQFMNETGPTDVITFQHGEIFISAETARRNARRFKNTLARELRLYVVHGLLHLHGFDDRTRAGAKKMESMQRKILAQVSCLK